MDEPSSTESNAITLRIRFKSTSLDEFIGRYSADVSPGGIFIRTRQPLDVGASLQFEFSLADGSPLLIGLGTVAWVRENDPARANNVPGMGLRFDKLTFETQPTHQKILAEKARREGKSAGTPYPPTMAASPISAARASSAEAERYDAPSTANPAQGIVTVASSPELPAQDLALTPAAGIFPPLSEPSGELAPISGEFSQDVKTVPAKGLSGLSSSETLPKSSSNRDTSQRDASEVDEAAPVAPLENWKTESQTMSEVVDEVESTVQAAPNASGIAKGTSESTSADEEFLSERGSGSRETFASVLRLSESENETPAAGISEATAAPTEEIQELSAGIPIEDTSSGNSAPTIALSVIRPSILPLPSPATPTPAAPTPFEIKEPPSPLAASQSASLHAVSSPSYGPLADGLSQPLRGKGSTKFMVGVGVLAAAVAFGTVYLLRAKPWRPATPPISAHSVATPAVSDKQISPPIVVEKPVQPLAEPAKAPEGTQPAIAKKPAVEEVPSGTAGKAAMGKPSPAGAAEKAPLAMEEKPPAKANPGSKPAPRSGEAAHEEKGGVKEEIYRLLFRSTPFGAEVFIDGDYFCRTPCERRVLDKDKWYTIGMRRVGFDNYERVLGASEDWQPKHGEWVLTVSGKLKKSAKVAPPVEPKPSVADSASAGKPEPKSESKVEPKSEAKPAVKADPKPESKSEVKPAASATDKAPAPGFKPVPNFDEPIKAKE